MKSSQAKAFGLAAMLAAAAWAGGAPAVAQRQPERQVPASRESVQLSFAPIVKQAAPAVVNVYARGRVTVRSPFDDPLLRQLFGDRLGMPQERIQSSLGSGVIVSKDGIIVTNTHVVKVGSQAEIRVVLSDRREFDAKVILQDEKVDIAVLRIEGGEGNLPTLQLGDSDDLEVGDMVLAIGNPFGVGQSVTQGIVSALGRSLGARSSAQAFIQTDAAVNPGNSGGALVDLSGRLVGINTAIISGSGASHGIGFAVPSNLVRVFVRNVEAGRSRIERPWLGVALEPVTRETAQGLGLDRPGGALIRRVHPAGPAAEARLEPGDVIIAIDGHAVSDPQEVIYRLTTRGIGNAARLTIVRQGRHTTVEVHLRAPPAAAEGNEVRNLAGQHPLSGARVATMSPAIAEELGVEEEAGVAILQIVQGTPAQLSGLQRGDVIVSFEGQPVDSAAKLEELLRAQVQTRQQQLRTRQVPSPWQLELKRDGRLRRLASR
jgi:Do/DeqQ family serine protease